MIVTSLYEVKIDWDRLIKYDNYLYDLSQNKSVPAILMLDTGCTSISISNQHMIDMGYSPIGINKVDAADGEYESNIYLLKNFWIFGHEFGDVYVSSCKLKNLDYSTEEQELPRFHGLLGMKFLECFNWSYDSELSIFKVTSLNQKKYNNFKSMPPTKSQLSSLISKNLILPKPKQLTRSTVFTNRF